MVVNSSLLIVLAALRGGDFEGLVAVLDPDVVVRADSIAAPPNGTEVRGARTWAKGAVAFSRFAQFVQPALVNGAVGLVWAPGGRLFRALSFKIASGKIVEVEIIADPERVRQLDLAVLDD
jgi:RNA polymerase sigma-70 factor (ECF subfamily)